MGQYFEITYNGPFGGLHVQAPANLIPSNYSPAFNDFMLRNAELRSRPAFVRQTKIPVVPATHGFSTVGMFGSLQGGLGQLGWKTFGVDSTGVLYSLDYASGAYKWTNVGGTSSGAIVQPRSWRSFNNVLYVSYADPSAARNGVKAWNGGVVNPGYVDQVAFSGATNPPVGGQSIYGGLFIDELADHLLLFNTSEGDVAFGSGGIYYPARVRWSNSGFDMYGGGAFGSNLGTSGATFDPTINTDAGFADLLEVSAEITGEMMLGTVGYVFRNQGITQMNPTGSGAGPFTFNHLWSSENGVGNLMPFTCAQYGLMGVFVASDNIYQLSPSSFSVIGGFARDAIMADLAIATNYPAASIIPGFNYGYVYMTYQLAIPQTVDGTPQTVLYIYGFEDQNWSRWILPGMTVLGKPWTCAVGVDVAPPNVNSEWASLTFQEGSGLVASLAAKSSWYAMYPVEEQTGIYSLRVFDTTSFDDSMQGSSYSFRVEDVALQRVPTINRVVLAYHDLGPGEITVSLSATNDDGTPISASTTKNIGSASATGKLTTSFIDLQLTGFRPQLTISRAAGSGQLSLVTVTLVGEVEQVTI